MNRFPAMIRNDWRRQRRIPAPVQEQNRIMFEYIEHTADAGFRVVADDREELFEDAATALFNLIVEDLDRVEPAEIRHVRISGTDDAYLLFDWLDKLLYLHETQRLVFCRFVVRLTDEGLDADVAGEPLDAHRHRPLHEVKAITYHGLNVSRTADGWQAQVIVDI
jgi:SHS2 domain-containing protein